MSAAQDTLVVVETYPAEVSDAAPDDLSYFPFWDFFSDSFSG